MQFRKPALIHELQHGMHILKHFKFHKKGFLFRNLRKTVKSILSKIN